MVQASIGVSDLDAIVLDFDGVLTDNFVYVSQQGIESVRCSRADGLAFDVLRKVGLRSFILSTEKNAVVAARGAKLSVPTVQGISDKRAALEHLAASEKMSLTRVLYVGNDINDLHAMRICGYSACPCDSHAAIKAIAQTVLESRGGAGVVRELVESVLKIDAIRILYGE